MNGKLRWGLAVGVVGTAVLLWFVPNFALRQALAFALLALWPILTGVFLFEGGWLARMVCAGGLALLGQIFVSH